MVRVNKLKAMRLYVEVVQRRSFSQAAHALHLGVASVSEQISALEKSLGVRLLDRTTRAVAPTFEGVAYYDLARRVLQDIEDAERAIAAPATALAGRVRVESPRSLLRRLILPSLQRFHELYPAVELDFVTTEAMFRTSRGLADLTLRAALPGQFSSPPGAVSLGRSRSVCAASPAYLARFPPPSSLGDLSRHRCLGFADPASGRLWEWFFQQHGEVVKLDVRCWLTLSAGELLADAAMDGLGLFMDLECNIAAQLESGELVEVLPAWSCPQPVGYMLHDRSRPLSRPAAAFLRFAEGDILASLEALKPPIPPRSR